MGLANHGVSRTTIRSFSSYVLSLSVAALLVGCGGSQPPIGAPGTVPQRLAGETNSGSSYRVLYTFIYPGTDGISPQDDLTVHDGKLYGTTELGGQYGRGTVFEVDTKGRESIVHSFTGGDGEQPMTAVTFAGDTLYGTTETGGECAPGCGTLYKIDKKGVERTAFAFDNFDDGEVPDGSLILSGGTLYGTTYFGGSGICYSGCGVLFSLSPSHSSKEATVHEFDHRDGGGPNGRLILFKGAFYGTTFVGGHQTGTAYKVTTAGREYVLYRFRRGYKRDFGRGKDGWGPAAGLAVMNGVLYGTTLRGGTGTACGVAGCGTVYSITRDGQEHVIHSFQGGTDGAAPYGDLVIFHDKLYGTTKNGGSTCSGNGCGIIFSIDAAGKEEILHTFSGEPDGQWPTAGLALLNGTLYGTTRSGGSYATGTVFTLKP
jgi:uncharacterized repeat protein (TIGR03803 family)